METIIPAGIALLQQLISTSGLTSPLVKGAVDLVTALAPVVVQEYKDLKPVVTNIITALKADPSVQMDDLKALQAAEILIDADFEAAASSAIAEDASDTPVKS